MQNAGSRIWTCEPTKGLDSESSAFDQTVPSPLKKLVLNKNYINIHFLNALYKRYLVRPIASIAKNSETKLHAVLPMLLVTYFIAMLSTDPNIKASDNEYNKNNGREDLAL